MGEGGGSRPEHTGDLNLTAAAALVSGLVTGGVRRAVISPGSRSSPLALAADHCPHLTSTILPDERSAAFFALGQARAEGRPVLVIATSGTAPANWFPAVIEASMDEVPLVLVSADRPEELLRTGANQTVDQEFMFGRYPRDYLRLPAPTGRDFKLFASTGCRAADGALWPRPGPVHVNAAFREPLLPSADEPALDWPEAAGEIQRPSILPDPSAMDRLERRLAGGNGVILCGRARYPAAFAQALGELAHRLRCPVLADPLSNLRWGTHRRDNIVTGADLFLRRRAGGPRADWILQFGAVPTSRAIQEWLAAQEGTLVPVAESGDWPDPSRRARSALHGDSLAVARSLLERDLLPAPADWLDAWQQLDRAALALVDEPGLHPPEADVVRAVESGLASGSSVFVGSSMPVRAFDAFARGRPQALTAVGNRGASGIDGCVSTAAGLASCRPTIGLIGDLALYHDMNGLLGAAAIDSKLLVIENGGGAIFGLLPQRNHRQFERLWRTPTGLSCHRVAALYDLRHVLVEAGEPLAEIISAPPVDRGLELVEIRIDAEQSWARYRNLWNAAADL